MSSDRRRTSVAWFFLILLLSPFCVSPSGLADERTANLPAHPRLPKKLIEFGWDEPSPSFMRQHCEQMDNVGFDGLVFHLEPVVAGKTMRFSHHAWSSVRFEYEHFERDLRALWGCTFQHLTDNFVRISVYPGTVDWFDDAAFAVVAHNAKVAARVARESRSKGFLFDVETYAQLSFSYDHQARKSTKTFAEYEVIVQQRGREFMRAINSEYDDIVIMLTYGYLLSGHATKGDRSTGPYGLLKNFLDGMFEVASEQTVLVDGYEQAYSYREPKQYLDGYRAVRDSRARSAVPAQYDARLEVGFGVWMDMNFRRFGWNTHDFDRNYFTPRELAHTLAAALRLSDRYVWLYTEMPKWWTHELVPEPYRLALKRAKQLAVRAQPSLPVRRIKGDEVRAADQVDVGDESTFAGLDAAWSMVANLPKAWLFRTDPGHVGRSKSWFSASASGGAWKEVEIGRFWEELTASYVGDAWYKLTWTAQDFVVPPGARVALWFGAVDETAQVWINGEFVGGHDEGPAGWDRRFAVDVTGRLRPGQPNTIVVLVGNAALAGGIWKSVKLAVSR